MEVWWLIFGIADPKVHVDEENVAELATDDFFFRHARCWREAMIEIDGEAETAIFCPGHHCFGVSQVIADGFLDEDVLPGGECLHCGDVVIGAILDASGGDGNHLDIFFAEECFDVVVGFGAEVAGGGIGALGDDVADGDELGEGIGFVDSCVCPSDVPHADDGCTYCHAFFPFRSGAVFRCFRRTLRLGA